MKFGLFVIIIDNNSIKCYNAIDIKCLNKLMYPFVLRFLNGEEIQEEDKVFFHEGCLATFLKTPEISIVTEMPRYHS